MDNYELDRLRERRDEAMRNAMRCLLDNSPDAATDYAHEYAKLVALIDIAEKAAATRRGDR